MGALPIRYGMSIPAAGSGVASAPGEGYCIVGIRAFTLDLVRSQEHRDESQDRR